MVRFEVTEDAILLWDLHTKIILGGAAYIECEKVIEIIALHIDEGSRNNGYGTQLMRLIQSHFQKDIGLGVLAENKDAQRFYERLGFKFVRRIRTGPALYLIKPYQ